jgi:hypothetical protein
VLCEHSLLLSVQWGIKYTVFYLGAILSRTPYTGTEPIELVGVIKTIVEGET